MTVRILSLQEEKDYILAAPYLQNLEEQVSGLRPLLPADIEIACKHFFSGAAAYAENKIFMSLSPAGLALKLPEDTRAKLMASGGKPLRYFPKAPIKKDYVVLPSALTTDREALAALILASLAFADEE